jgi:hypothetical protein
MRGDLLGEFAILWRVALGDAGSENSGRPSARLDSGTVSSGVDAPCQAGDDRHPTFGQKSGHALCPANASLRSFSRSDNCNGADVLVAKFSAKEKEGRQVRNQPEVGWVSVIEDSDELGSSLGGCGSFCIDSLEQFVRIPDTATEDLLRRLSSRAAFLDLAFPQGVESTGELSLAGDQVPIDAFLVDPDGAKGEKAALTVGDVHSMLLPFRTYVRMVLI